MKALLAGAAVLLGVVAGVVFLWPPARSGPEPIRYGIDTCGECRMHVTRPGFGGQLRDRNRVLTTYDDVGCLLRAMLKRHGEMPEAWVEDHAGGGFVSLLEAHLVRGATATPMGYGIVAFRDETAARAYAAEAGGALVPLEDVVRNPERLARTEGRTE